MAAAMVAQQKASDRMQEQVVKANESYAQNMENIRKDMEARRQQERKEEEKRLPKLTEDHVFMWTELDNVCWLQMTSTNCRLSFSDPISNSFVSIYCRRSRC